MNLAPLKADSGAGGCDGLIAHHIIAHGFQRGATAPLIGSLHTVLGRYIVLIRQIPGQVHSAEGLQLRVIKGLDGIHIIVTHFFGAVSRNLLKSHGAAPADMIVLRHGDLVIPLGVRMGAGGKECAVCLRRRVEQPEGHIDALDLLQMAAV